MYPLLYHAHHQQHLDDLPFWQKLAEACRGKSILELGCGSGRVLIPLAEAGHTLTGIDHDPAMLALLRRLLPARLRPRVAVFQRDMRDFQLSSRFALIFLACNTFSYFPSAQRSDILRNVRCHLLPDGLFAFSIPNPVILANLPPLGEPVWEESFTHPVTGNPVDVISSWQVAYDPSGGGKLHFRWRYDHHLAGGEVESMQVTATHFLDPAECYLEEVEAAALRVESMYGDYQQGSYTPDSPYLIVVASPGG